MLSALVLGPQALGTTRRYVLGPVKGPDGVNLTATVALTGAEPLVCRLWRGEGGDALATLAPTWLSTALGTITLPITAAVIAGLAPGPYRIELTATIGGEPLAVLPPDATIDLADAPGATATAGWLVSAEAARAALGDAFGRRADLPLLIGAASRAAEGYCHRAFAQAEVDEYHGGTGRRTLHLRRPPVAAITSIEVDGVAVVNTGLDQWQLDPDSGEMVRGTTAVARSATWGSTWSAGTRNVRVRYTGGYAAIPEPVRQATILIAKHLADASQHSGVLARERIGDYEYEVAPRPSAGSPWPLVVGMLLDPYTLPVVG